MYRDCNGGRRVLTFIREQFAPPDAAMRQLRADQIVLGAENSVAVGASYPFAIPLIGLAAWQWASSISVVIWVLAVLLAVYRTQLVAEKVLANRHAPGAVIPLGLHMFLNGVVFISVFGGGALFFWAPGEPVNHMFWIMLCGVCMAIAAAQTGAFLPIGMTSMIYGLIVIAVCVREGGATYYIIAGLGAVAMVFVSGILRTIHRMTTRMLTLARTQDSLVEKLTQANAAKSDFLAKMSHELRTPLNAVIGFSDVMRQELMGPIAVPVYKNYLEDIHFSGTHLLSLINDILDLSKIEAGKFELNEGPVNFYDLVEETVRLIDLKAKDAGVTFINEAMPGVVIHADERAMRQVAANLASNAVKFTPKGGTVRVTTGLTANGDMAFYVQDNGHGIRPEDLATIFERFGQGRHDVAVNEKGTGLGLAIVKGLILAHGGDVSIESEIGKGTTVTVTLPAWRFIRVEASSAA
jgi:two-component system cell cycle sensor histidine kinase PleC